MEREAPRDLVGGLGGLVRDLPVGGMVAAGSKRGSRPQLGEFQLNSLLITFLAERLWSFECSAGSWDSERLRGRAAPAGLPTGHVCPHMPTARCADICLKE